MKIAIVFFSYTEDAELLGNALRAVQKLQEKYPEDIVTAFVRDDATAPLAGAPAGVDYKQTTFDRCGNLNGAVCVKGMLQEFNEIVELGYDYVVKADCDTYINHLEWLSKDEHVLHVGTNHVDNYSSGACYALSAAGVRKLYEFVQDATVHKRVQRAFCEDRAICHMAGILGRSIIRENKANLVKHDMLYHDWLNDYVADMDSLAVPYAVDFKRCRWHADKEDWCADREKAAARMAEYAAYMAAR